MGDHRCCRSALGTSAPIGTGPIRVAKSCTKRSAARASRCQTCGSGPTSTGAACLCSMVAPHSNHVLKRPLNSEAVRWRPILCPTTPHVWEKNRSGSAEQGPGFIGRKPTLAKPTFFQTDFGQFGCFIVLTDFGQTDFGQFQCFSVLVKLSEPKKTQTPKTQRPTFKPEPQTLQTQNLNPGRGRPNPLGPTLRGHNCSGFGLHLHFWRVLVLLWLWLLWLMLVWTFLDPSSPDHPPQDRPKFRVFFPLPTPISFFLSHWGS